MSQQDPATGPWHLDKRVPVALLLAIVIQTFGVGWWAASISERVSSLESTRTEDKGTGSRLAVLESQMNDIKSSLQRIESQLSPAQQRP
jgi:Tfp pilus assembly protein PilO